MIWALGAGRVDTRGLELEPVASDIQTLNEWALDGRLEVTALSAGAYPAVADRYRLLPHGASFGDGYGPIVVAPRGAVPRRAARGRDRDPRRADDRDAGCCGSLSATTSARGTSRSTGFWTRSSPAARAAGLLIHEGQLTYADAGLHKLLDLGVWWRDETGLPLPLGLVAIRRDVERADDVSAVLRAAIGAGLEHRDEALAYAREFGRGIDAGTADEFVAHVRQRPDARHGRPRQGSRRTSDRRRAGDGVRRRLDGIA